MSTSLAAFNKKMKSPLVETPHMTAVMNQFLDENKGLGSKKQKKDNDMPPLEFKNSNSDKGLEKLDFFLLPPDSVAMFAFSVTVKVSENELDEQPRYMGSNAVVDKFSVYKAHWKQLVDSVVEYHHFDVVDILVSLSPRNDTSIIVGVICMDGNALKLTRGNIRIQSIYGESVPVSFDEMKQYTVFPGQVVGMRYVNPQGVPFVLEKLFTVMPLPFFSPRPPLVLDSNCDIRIMVASGPWLIDLNGLVSDAPFTAFLDQIVKRCPQLVILTGPFVDSENNTILESDREYSKWFVGLLNTQNEKLVSMLAEKGYPMPTMVFVPSFHDAFHYPTFPQPPFDCKIAVALNASNFHNFGFENSVVFASNPCMLEINGGAVTIGVTSNDSIKQLAAQEVSSDDHYMNRLARCCGHLIEQRSFSPLYPTDLSTTVIETMDRVEWKYTPDILIVPSDARYFLHRVHDVLCVNPGRISRGSTAGTFAIIDVQNTERPNVVSRCNSEIVNV